MPIQKYPNHEKVVLMKRIVSKHPDGPNRADRRRMAALARKASKK